MAFIKNIKIALVALLFSSINATAQKMPHERLTPTIKDSLKQEIQTMLVADQKYRWMIQLGEMEETKLEQLKKLDSRSKMVRMQDVAHNRIGLTSHQKDSLGLLQSVIDSDNFKKISAIIYKFGYPKKYVASYDVPTILQHNSFLISDGLFKLLLQEVKNKQMPAIEYALLYDKAQLDKKRPELYYVMEYYDADTNTSKPHKPENIDSVNKAREEIGLKKIK